MRYFFGFLAVVALIVLVFVLVLRGFGGKHATVQSQLTDYAATQTVVRLTIEGPVNADQDHRVIRTTIGRDSNSVDIIDGYQGHVEQTKTYPNNQAAYATFLRALQLQGYAKGISDAARADSRGVCPTGKVYTFEVITGSDTVQKFWSTSCGGGTFKGAAAIIRQLFRSQISDYAQVTRGINLF